MIDIEEKNDVILETQPAPGAPDAAQPQPNDDHMSKGEKWYNRIVYQGINYWLNLGLSLYFTDIFTHGGGKLDFTRGWGKGFYDKGVKNITHALNSGKMHPKTAGRAAEVILGTFTLNTGGNVLLIPMKLMEDRKRPIVHWLNKHVFHEQQVATDGHELTPDEIYLEQEQPIQNWIRVIGRRTLAVSSTIVTGLGVDWALKRKLEPSELAVSKGETYEDGTKRFTRWITSGINYLSGGKAHAANDTVKRYIGYAALDSIYTGITATIMHRTNGAKHLKGRGKKEAEIFRETDKDIPLPDNVALNALHKMSDIEKNSDADVTPSSVEEKLNGYKKKPVLPAGKYTDMTKSGETDYSIAP